MKRLFLLFICIVAGSHTMLFSQSYFQYDYEVSRLSREVNSSDNDYAPTLSGDGNTLYFTSYRSEGAIGEADVFFVSRSGPDWNRIFNPGSPLNTKANDGTITVSGNSSFVVFSTEKRPDKVGDMDIHLAALDNGRFTDVRSAGKPVNSKAWESQPTITADGRILYYASDRDGGYGGTDIWMASKVGRTQDGLPIWGDPVNLGPSINTEDDERSPFISQDGSTLYFASEGHQGFGGYDIYMAVQQTGEWNKAENLGSIINSRDDEMFFHAPQSDRPFYFASSRSGGFGGFDIFSGTPNVFGRGLFHLTINVVDSTNQALPSVVVITDIESGDTVSTVFTNIGQRDYEVHLPANRRYRATGNVRGRNPIPIELEKAKPNETCLVKLTFDTFTLAEFDRAKYNIPFFVTGYYRPNTADNLEELFDLQDGKLRKATYIEDFARGSKPHKQYQAYAKVIAQMFDTIYASALNEIFPRFASETGPDEVLEIYVTGFADPQPFVGTYHDDEKVRFLDRSGVEHVVSKGSQITNLELSGLRAWYSAQHLDEMFEEAANNGKPEYKNLKDAGRLRLVVVGASVSQDFDSFETQSRIGVTMQRADGKAEFDLNKSSFE